MLETACLSGEMVFSIRQFLDACKGYTDNQSDDLGWPKVIPSPLSCRAVNVKHFYFAFLFSIFAKNILRSDSIWWDPAV